ILRRISALHHARQPLGRLLRIRQANSTILKSFGLKYEANSLMFAVSSPGASAASASRVEQSTIVAPRRCVSLFRLRKVRPRAFGVGLARYIAECPKDGPAFIATMYGRARSEKAFSTWISEAACDAGLPPKSSPHGVRKAACRRLAEAGCSAREIMSITGHTDIREIERYCREAARKKIIEIIDDKSQMAIPAGLIEFNCLNGLPPAFLLSKVRNSFGF
ncbi:tyrosine-type recombinase/integrase, partial [Bradyrhizobium diazoefficiens]